MQLLARASMTPCTSLSARVMCRLLCERRTSVFRVSAQLTLLHIDIRHAAVAKARLRALDALRMWGCNCAMSRLTQPRGAMCFCAVKKGRIYYLHSQKCYCLVPAHCACAVGVAPKHAHMMCTWRARTGALGRKQGSARVI